MPIFGGGGGKCASPVVVHGPSFGENCEKAEEDEEEEEEEEGGKRWEQVHFDTAGKKSRREQREKTGLELQKKSSLYLRGERA